MSTRTDEIGGEHGGEGQCATEMSVKLAVRASAKVGGDRWTEGMAMKERQTRSTGRGGSRNRKFMLT